MAYLDVSRIASWHAHVYFDAASRDAASKFRDVVTAQFGKLVEMGRFHEQEVGPHPRWSYQIAFAPTQFSDVVGWLALTVITARSMCSCIPILTMNCATIWTAHFGSVEAINWTYGRSAAEGWPRRITRLRLLPLVAAAGHDGPKPAICGPSREVPLSGRSSGQSPTGAMQRQPRNGLAARREQGVGDGRPYARRPFFANTTRLGAICQNQHIQR